MKDWTTALDTDNNCILVSDLQGNTICELKECDSENALLIAKLPKLINLIKVIRDELKFQNEFNKSQGQGKDWTNHLMSIESLKL